ncbi:hypothetical protein LUW76_41380 [Actinomadura madurae]|uniref:hypothetical protein n=1 Tax=Actinomadura madurae TaxID=1993 RepID=UPI002026DEC6|nr:hypothetical protein [Actinomadura madurae]URN00252.1 hypothetical protein LUW76_41380 [Actinomadura madurae]
MRRGSAAIARRAAPARLPGSVQLSSAATTSGGVARTVSSSAPMSGSGVRGGGVRKSGMYPAGWTTSRSGPMPSPRSRGRTVRTHGRCSAWPDGSARTRRLRTISHRGEYANRTRATSSGARTNSII